MTSVRRGLWSISECSSSRWNTSNPFACTGVGRAVRDSVLYEGLFLSCTGGKTDISEVSLAFAEDMWVTCEVVSCKWFPRAGGLCVL